MSEKKDDKGKDSAAPTPAKAEEATPATQASQVVTPVPQAKADKSKKPVQVITGKPDTGARFYGEDFGDGKLVDKLSGKTLVLGSIEKTIKVVDPKNPNVMRPKKVVVSVYTLKK